MSRVVSIVFGQTEKKVKGKSLPTVDLKIPYVRSCLKIKIIQRNILELGYFQEQHHLDLRSVLSLSVHMFLIPI